MPAGRDSATTGAARRNAAHTTGSPDPAVAPSPGNPRFPLFDGLRAIAALSILLFHAGNHAYQADPQVDWLGYVVARLNVGVPIFFVISGFLLYRPFAAARMQGSRMPRIRDYARRRVLRIVPAYWVALILLAPLTTVEFPGGWWRYFGFLQAYQEFSFGQGIGPAWSLTVEVAFYASLPLYVLLAGRLLRGLRAATAVRVELALLALAALASVVLSGYAYGAGNPVLAYSLPASLMWFAGGMALALLSAAAHGRRPTGAWVTVSSRAGLAWAVAGAVALTAVVLLPPLPDPAPRTLTDWEWALERALYALVATLLVCPAVFGAGRGALARRVLSSRPLQWLGLISYGIFLWHGPILAWWHAHAPAALVGEAGPAVGRPWLVFVGLVVVTLVATIPIAAASYYLVERPILRRKNHLRSAAGSARAPTSSPARGTPATPPA